MHFFGARPGATFPRSLQPIVPDSTLEEKWCGRHHVVDSRRNRSLPPDRRVFFDVLPQLRVRQGNYSDVPLYTSGDITDDPNSYEDVLRWKWSQYPQFAGTPGSLASSRASFPTVDKLDASGFAIAGSINSPRKPAASSSSSPQRGKKALVRTTMSGPPELMHFVRWCEAKHGHLVNTWRKLDKDGSMYLTKKEFLWGLNAISYPKNGHVLWNLYSKDEHDMLSFLHFVPDLAIDLARFKHWAEENFHSARDAFTALDSNHRGKLSYKDFLHACERFGMCKRLEEVTQTLFVMLDDERDQGNIGQITREELEFLDGWRCPPYLWADPDFDAKHLFWRHLMSWNKDCPLIAWRRSLDQNCDYKVCYSEFYKYCAKRMRSGVFGSHPSISLVNKVYVTFDPFRSGYISLRRWDYHSYELLLKFTVWAKLKFGKVTEVVPAWETETSHGVSYCLFRIGVQELHLCEADLALLFSGLSLEGIGNGARISLRELAYLDRWEHDKLLEEEVAWEKMVGNRFKLSNLQAAKDLKKFRKLTSAVSVVMRMGVRPPAHDHGRSLQTQ